ncbi:Lrp/AsnC family leucine-responsive transcriptional regulator [Bacillus capparidis]|uniref:Lrp/AsnC family leucine-responsive transcriptional regulator n=1 Tax=Bacillus capparidis TaxID=1840411 RepID=A0ABS4CZU8_9BACI|nr:Lrp/AsnC family leucine-responsive transcriptional regulator [Bacillus capparidis]
MKKKIEISIQFEGMIFVDQLDVKLLQLLQEDGRITISELSKRLALSRPSISERIAKLQESGVIEGFGARISPAKLGKDTLMIIRITGLQVTPQKFESFIQEQEEIIECHRVTGEVSYFMKAAVSGIGAMGLLIDRLIPYGIPNTSIIISSPVPFRHMLPEEG